MSEARRAYCALMYILSTHPYFERFALTRPLTPEEKNLRNHAVTAAIHIVYHIMWHYRVKIPGCKQKTASQTMDDVPDTRVDGGRQKGSAGYIFKQSILRAIRALAGSRRNTIRNNNVKVRSIDFTWLFITMCYVRFLTISDQYSCTLSITQFHDFSPLFMHTFTSLNFMNFHQFSCTFSLHII